MKPIVGVQVTRETHRALRQIARAHGATVSWVLRKIIEQHLYSSPAIDQFEARNPKPANGGVPAALVRNENGGLAVGVGTGVDLVLDTSKSASPESLVPGPSSTEKETVESGVGK
jgi:hypothetical protein